MKFLNFYQNKVLLNYKVIIYYIIYVLNTYEIGISKMAFEPFWDISFLIQDVTWEDFFTIKCCVLRPGSFGNFGLSSLDLLKKKLS